MPTISNIKKEKISEQILSHLFTIFPKQIFISDISKEIARDEEFVKKLLIELEKKGIVTKIVKNSKGHNYLRRTRWRITNITYEVYKKLQ
ncbi:MAG: hypothetical protein Q8N88_05270 [Nanoarchaeota archaeon]|nr:hypothetical protein [Nanoarchaeota archaeon]